MKISLLLKDIVRKNKKEKISINDILNVNKNNSYFLIFLLAVLSLIPTPFPIPIFSNFFGIVMTILFSQIFLDAKKLKLPKFIGNISIKKTIFEKLVNKTVVYIEKIENVSCRRITFYKNKFFMITIKFLLLIMCMCVITPLPIINTLPAVGVIITIFGILNSDGIFVIIGILFGILGISTLGLAIVFGKIFLQKIGFLK